MLRFLLLSLLLVAPGYPAVAERDLEADLKSLKSRISRLQSELHQVQTERDRLQQQLQAAEQEIGRLQIDIQTLSDQLTHLRSELSNQRLRQQQLNRDLEEQKQQVAQQITSAYRFGQQSQIKLLLNLQDPAQWSRLSRYHQYLLDARSGKIEEYLATAREIRQVTDHIEHNTVRLQDTHNTLKKRQQQLGNSQKQRQSMLAKLESDIQSKDRQMAELLKNRAQLEKLLQEVTEALANLPSPADAEPFQQRRGKMPLPVKGTTIKRFGQPKIPGKLDWEGMLIAANEGDSVAAIHHGRVVFSDYLRGHGLLLIIDHGDGFMSLYAHNQSLLKEAGQWVDSGEIVARAGNTGGLDRTALYFEIRHRGKPVNPARWCRKG